MWSALVESRIRHLVLKLELIDTLDLVHPYPKGFERSIVCHTDGQRVNASRGIFYTDFGASADDGTDKNALEVGQTTYTTIFYIGMAIARRPAGSTAPRKLDIAWPTSEFTKMCKLWDKYDEVNMGLCVKYIKR